MFKLQTLTQVLKIRIFRVELKSFTCGVSESFLKIKHSIYVHIRRNVLKHYEL